MKLKRITGLEFVELAYPPITAQLIFHHSDCVYVDKRRVKRQRRKYKSVTRL